jgi:hypothetical protein
MQRKCSQASQLGRIISVCPINCLSVVSLLVAMPASCLAQVLPPAAADALTKYEGRRQAIRQTADASLQKERQQLLTRLRATQKQMAGRDPAVAKAVEELIAKVESPTFTEWELQRIIAKDATTVTSEAAKVLARSYLGATITENEWNSLPAPEIDAGVATLGDTGIEAKLGDVFLILPHPTAKWRVGPESAWQIYRGREREGAYETASAWIVGPKPPAITEVRDRPVAVSRSVIVTATTSGRLFVGGQGNDAMVNAEGVIPFKVFRVKDR